MRASIRSFWAALLLSLLCVSARADPFTDSVRARCEAILGAAAEKGAVASAVAEAGALADLVAGWASTTQLHALAWSEGTRSLLETAALARTDGIGALAAQPVFCMELGLLIDSRDNPAGVMRLARRLAEERAEAVGRYPALAAALCVVHDTEFTRQINENAVKAPEPVAIFDYFVRNAGAMRLDPAKTPALLLVHVVDVTERIDQMEWALKTYGKQPAPGQRFFEIKYDYDAFRRGVPKKVTAAGDYRLESIKRHGGVCADQAYFAELVGKASGIPSCYVRAAGADVSHAWIGYLETRPRPAWDFSQGRYESYQNLRGQIHSPQTRLWISDADVGLLGGLVSANADDVRAAMAAAHAARRMGEGFKPPETAEGVQMRGTLRVTRTGAVADRLALLRAALTKCPFVPRAWRVVSDLASAGSMSAAQMDEWARAVERMCGQAHQDFTYDMLVAMIRSEKNPAAAHKMWDWAFTRFRARPDLASGARHEQGLVWERNKRPDLAWAAYEDILKNYINDGPMCVAALRSMRRLLDESGKRAAFLATVQDAARKVKQPGQMAGAFASQSNHYKIHAMLAEELDRAGRSAEAAQVRQRAGIEK